MENTNKLNNTKEVLEYIANKFPQCFILDGEGKPLKIGIFQDLAARLAEDTSVSKTQLRMALRQYTTSWRYLYGMKLGAQRIDLDGNPCGALETEHVAHAKRTLDESKAKAKAKKTAQKEAHKKRWQEARKADATNIEPKNTKAKTKAKSKTKAKVDTSRKINTEDLAVDLNVLVNMGHGNRPAQIIALEKDGIRVRLTNGLVMLVQKEHLRV